MPTFLVWQVRMLMSRLMMTIGEHGQAITLRLGSMGTSPARFMGSGQWSLVGLGLRYGFEIFLFKRASAAAAMAATTRICLLCIRM